MGEATRRGFGRICTGLATSVVAGAPGARPARAQGSAPVQAVAARLVHLPDGTPVPALGQGT